MNFSKPSVSDKMSSLPLYVDINDSLGIAIKKMEQYNVSKITVTDKDFNVLGVILKTEILKYLLGKSKRSGITKNLLKNFYVKDVLNKNSKLVLGYPGCDLQEITRIMESIKIQYLPIVQSPWNKKLQGFVQFDKQYI